MRIAVEKDSNQLVVSLALFVVSMAIFTGLPGSSPGNHTGPPVLSWSFLGGNPILLLPLLTLAVTGAVWYAVEREPLKRSVAVQYGPPQHLSPAEASALLNDSVKQRAIISTIVDLAVRGYLSLEQTDGSEEHPAKGEFIFHNLKKPNWANELAPHERDLMEHIFEYGEEPSLSTLRHGLPEYLGQIKEHIFRSLAEKKMYRMDPIWSRLILLFEGFAGLLVLWFLADGLNLKLTQYGLLSPVCFALAMAVILVFARKITFKSALGKDSWNHAAGFREFMRRVDAQRMKTLSPDIFEKYLPYAVAFGVETEWTATFKGMLTRPLSWYTGAFNDLLSGLDEDE